MIREICLKTDPLKAILTHDEMLGMPKKQIESIYKRTFNQNRK